MKHNIILGICLSVIIISTIILVICALKPKEEVTTSTETTTFTETENDVYIKESKKIVYLNNEDINTLNNYLKEIKKIPLEESVNLKLLGLIEIHINDTFIINMDRDESIYCEYTSDTSSHELRTMPKEFHDWVINKLDNE